MLQMQTLREMPTRRALFKSAHRPTSEGRKQHIQSCMSDTFHKFTGDAVICPRDTRRMRLLTLNTRQVTAPVVSRKFTAHPAVSLDTSSVDFRLCIFCGAVMIYAIIIGTRYSLMWYSYAAKVCRSLSLPLYCPSCLLFLLFARQPRLNATVPYCTIREHTRFSPFRRIPLSRCILYERGKYCSYARKGVFEL